MLNKILTTLGHHQAKTTPNTIFYKSPFNPSEKTPSFTVFKNSHSGEWTNYKDYSTDRGGDIYNFIMQYFNIQFKEAKTRVKELLGENPTQHTPTPNKPPLSSFNQLKREEPSYKILKVQPLQNKALIKYLENRKLNITFCKKYLNEIYYEIDKKNYFAISFVSDKGGREIRNEYFKGSFGTKAVSFLKPYPRQKRLKIFEGVYDFLAYITINDFIPHADYLILNSATLYSEKYLKNYDEIELYLDNDKRGIELKNLILKTFKNALDKSAYYSDFKDINEYLINSYCTN